MTSERVNIGCGRSPTPGWRNFDNSPALSLARKPLVYTVAKSLKLLSSHQVDNIEWNKKNKIEFANAAKHIPMADQSADVIYSSHMMEHLPHSGAKQFLNECFRVLESGGVVRLVLPDLDWHIQEYLKDKDADRFMNDTLVVAPDVSSRSAKAKVVMNGFRHHQWMYNADSLSQMVSSAGFKDVTVQTPGKTKIKNPDPLDMQEREIGSVVVEGLKP